jgi:predicted metal-dependent peptidase
MSSYDKSKRALHGVLSANEVMVKAKSKLMNSESGLASILLGLPLEEDSSFDTMATDGKVIKYNPDFALSLPMDEIKAVLIHEALHVVWGHHLRRGDRHPKLWNIATDYAINGYIVYKLGEHLNKLPEGALVSNKYVNKDYSVMSANEIYDILFGDDEALEEAIEQMQQQMGDDSDENESQGQGQDESEEDTQGSGSGDGDEESDEESEGQGSGGDADDDAETGDDENITGNGLSDERSPQTNQSGQIDLNDLPQMAGGVFDMTNEDGSELSDNELQEQITKLDAQVMMAEKVQGMLVSGGAGVDYLGGRKSELVEQVVPWEDMFRDMFTRVQSQNNTWKMPNRRHMARGIHMPSRDTEPAIKNVVMLVDVSGSTYGDRDSFVTEALAILEEFQVKKLMVNRYAGISLRNEQGEYFDVYDTDQGDEMPDKDEINFNGDGGTNFDAPFNAVEEFLDIDEIDLIVHFSDGEGYFSQDHDALLDTPICHVFSYGQDGDNYGGNEIEKKGFGEVIYMS